MGSNSKTTSTEHYEQKHEKKKFDKKKFWDMKLNKKRRVEEWEERRKKFAERKYHKDIKKNFKNHPNPKTEKYINHVVNEEATRRTPSHGISSLKAARQELQKKKEERFRKREAAIKKQNEIKQAMEQYKKKKAEKFKKLSKKTKLGQPVMKERLHLLLEEIKEKVER